MEHEDSKERNKDTDATTLVLGMDNFYLAGFANKFRPDTRVIGWQVANLFLIPGPCGIRPCVEGNMVRLAASQARAFWFSHISVMAEQRTERSPINIAWEGPPSWTTLAAGRLRSMDGEENDDADLTNMALQMDNLNQSWLHE